MQTPDEGRSDAAAEGVGVGCAADRRRAGVQPYDSSPVFGGGRLVAYRGRGRPRTLAGLEDWVAERFAGMPATPMWFARSSSVRRGSG